MQNLVEKLMSSQYATIYQFLELKLETQTVLESMSELAELNKQANNEAITEHLGKIREFLDGSFEQEDLENSNRAVQGVIMLTLKLGLQ